MVQISKVREYRNATNRKGKLINVNLLDGAGGEIRATLFNDVVDEYENMLKLGQVFTFAHGIAQVANPASKPRHRYELVFHANAEIEAMEDDPTIAGL